MLSASHSPLKAAAFYVGMSIKSWFEMLWSSSPGLTVICKSRLLDVVFGCSVSAEDTWWLVCEIYPLGNPLIAVNTCRKSNPKQCRNARRRLRLCREFTYGIVPDTKRVSAGSARGRRECGGLKSSLQFFVDHSRNIRPSFSQEGGRDFLVLFCVCVWVGVFSSSIL